MPATRPDLTGVAAVVVTACPLLAAYLTALHPDLCTALLTRLAGIGQATTTIYLGTDLDDAGVWARAVKLRAREVLVLPDQDALLVALLTQHLGATA